VALAIAQRAMHDKVHVCIGGGATDVRGVRQDLQWKIGCEGVPCMIRCTFASVKAPRMSEVYVRTCSGEQGTSACHAQGGARLHWWRRQWMPRGVRQDLQGSPIPVGSCHNGVFLILYSEAGGLAPHTLGHLAHSTDNKKA